MAVGVVLVVDDEEHIRETLKDILEDEGYEVITVSNGRDALSVIEVNPVDVAIVDMLLPEKGGIETLEAIKDSFPAVPVVMISGHGDIKSAVECMKKGAFDFLEKPLSVSRVVTSVRNAIKVRNLEMENIELKKGRKPVLVGSSESMKILRDTIDSIARSSSTVLITGESGTGKEVVARLIHFKSRRANKPFVAVNCAAIPDTLIEAELFGYEKGAFTGANTSKKGKFEVADGGTIFLDEIGDLSLQAQAKVLRVLQEGTFAKVGGTREIKVDVRVISATNKDLKKSIESGTFREDLFYRLNVIPVYIPPLRERLDDIPELVEHFVRELSEETGGKTLRFSDGAFELMKKYRWPGNVRELRNFVERLMIMLPDGKEVGKRELMIYAPDMFSEVERESTSTLREARRKFERDFILRKLREAGGNITRTAKLLGVERTWLYRKMKELGIDYRD